MRRSLAAILLMVAMVVGVAACGGAPIQPVSKYVDIPKADGTKEPISLVFYCYDDPFGLTIKGVMCFDSQGKMVANNSASGDGPVKALAQTLAASAANATFVGAMMGLFAPAAPSTSVNVKTTGSTTK